MEKISILNKEARFHYDILETLEAGIALQGPEVKSLRRAQANLKGGFARIVGNEVWLHNMHISPYPFAAQEAKTLDPLRARKLLLHRGQIRKLLAKLNQKGLTLIPLKVYFKGSVAKVELALAKGRQLYDKREKIKQRELSLKMRRALKHKNV
jgi:SsrA-binding protein